MNQKNIRIKKYLLDKLKEEYQDVSFNTAIDIVLMEIAIAKKYKHGYVRINSQIDNTGTAGEDTNVRIQVDLLEELRKEFPDMSINEIVSLLLTQEEIKFRGLYPEQGRSLTKDYPGKSIYEVGLIFRSSASK